METKLIQNEYYLLLISPESELKEGDLVIDYYTSGNPANIRQVLKVDGDRIYDGDVTYNLRSSVDKIIAYFPLKEKVEELDLPLLPNPFEDINTQQFALDWFAKANKRDIIFDLGWMKIFEAGYKAAQSKQFSLEDMKKAIEMAREGDFSKYYGCMSWVSSEEEIIQSLSAQQLPVSFEPEIETELDAYYRNGVGGTSELKTITNSEGKQELVGTYKY